MTFDTVLFVLLFLLVSILIFKDELYSLFKSKPEHKQRDKAEKSTPPPPSIDKNRSVSPNVKSEDRPRIPQEQSREKRKPPHQEERTNETLKREAVNKVIPQQPKPERQKESTETLNKPETKPKSVTRVSVQPPTKPKPTPQPIPEPQTLKVLPNRVFPDFDNSRLLGLGLSQGDANDFVMELAEQIESHIPQLEAAIEAEEYEHIERLTHSLKGSATNLGTGGVANVLIDFNTYCKTGKDKEIILAHMDNLKTYYAKLKSQFS